MRLFSFLLFLALSTSLSAQTQVGGDIDGEASSDFSGLSVSLSADGKRLASGAPYNGGNGSQSGHVRVYEFEETNGTWVQLGSDINGNMRAENLGSSVSLSADGKRVAIGAGIFRDSPGRTRIYEYDEVAGTWNQIGGDIDEEAVGDMEGSEVSLSADGTRVAIGGPRNNDNGENAGHARIFEETNGTWTQLGQDLDGEAAGDIFGYSVSLSADGTRVAVGGYFNDGNGFNSGHTIIYQYGAGVWTQVGADIDGENSSDFSGFSVSLSTDGKRVAIGAQGSVGSGPRSGFVSIYEETAGVWNRIGNPIAGEAVGDNSGSSVSLSADGKRVAIGAPFNDDGGSSAGHVRLYEERSGVWTQLGSDIDGEAAVDYSGESVALSADAMTVAIGAANNDGSGSNAGHVRVYDLTNAVLPVNLLTFTATATAKATQLSWATATETENDGFKVEHATDATHWRTVGRVTGAGTAGEQNDYAFQHDTPAPGTNYYRLKQLDLDGTFTYSNVVTINFSGESETLAVYPNPSRVEGAVTITLPDDFRDAPVRLFSAEGKLLRSFVGNTTNISLTGLLAGSYLLRVTTGKRTLEKWVVVR